MDKKNIYTRILNGISEGVYFVDINRKISFWNKAAEEITGYSSKEIVNRYCCDNILDHLDETGNKLCASGCPLLDTIKDGKPREQKIYLRHKNGFRIPVIIKIISIYEKGKMIGAVQTFTDMSPNKMLLQSNNNLMENIFKDELTKLPNRKYLNVHLNSVMLKYKNLKVVFGLIFLDIDVLKKINDNYGHNIGDKILKMVAKVFGNTCRDNDIIGRWGGDEFIGVFENINKKRIIEIANRIRMLIENSELDIDNKKIRVTISIGVSLIKNDETIENLIKRADEGVYLAKKNGRNRVEFKK